MPENKTRWKFNRFERISLTIAIIAFIVFGALIERRTALRRIPMTDFGVFTIASGAIWSGQNVYNVPDWHGWHYQYPPALAILFWPLIEPTPQLPPILKSGELYTDENTPYGYELSNHVGYGAGSYYYGLREQNFRFVCTTAIWYLLSLFFIFFSAHVLASALEGSNLKTPLPEDKFARSRWWKLRLLPLLICSPSLGRDLMRGQVDVLMLFAVSVGIYLAVNKRFIKSGLWLAFPASVKMIPPIFLIYPFWRRQWRLCFGVIIGLTFFLVVLPACTLGATRTVDLYQTWIHVLAQPALGNGTDTSRLTELTGMTSTDNQSLLAAIHNWHYFSLPRELRPQEAPKWERHLTYLVGLIMLAGILLTAGFRRSDSKHGMIIFIGLLTGLAFVINPVVHNFYHLLMLPTIAALLDLGLPKKPGERTDWKLVAPCVTFILVEILAVIPHLSSLMRDLGAPLLSLIYLMVIGAIVLAGKKSSNC